MPSARYQPQTRIALQDGVTTFGGRDALNGLPVLIYTFPGEPTARVGELVSEHIPTILSATTEGDIGQLVTTFSREYRSLSASVAPDEVELLLLETARALLDAAEAGVVHGDLRPERFLRAGGHHLLEGYGVPWAVSPSEYSPPERIAGASYAGDLFSWAMSVRFLAGPLLPGELRDLLSSCLSAEPEERPRAREVYARLSAYARGEEPPPEKPREAQTGGDNARRVTSEEAPFGDFSLDDFSFEEDAEPPLGEAFEPAPERPSPSRAVRVVPERETPAPAESLRRTDATSAYSQRRAHYEARRSGKVGAPEEDEDFEVVDDINDAAPDPTAGSGGRRVALLSLLVIAVLVLLALLLFNQGVAETPPTL